MQYRNLGKGLTVSAVGLGCMGMRRAYGEPADRKEINKPLVPDSRPETIRSSVEGSLKRLQTDHLVLYYQHRIDTNVPVR